ncbi:MAG: hypothetical protein HQK72_14220 [Desulfamplus sp.]|nr:hypothetical protein [Desulfamplus sp.]
MVTLDYAINTIEQLPITDQEILIDIVYHRLTEKRRKEIAEDAKKSIADFHAGKLKTQSVEDIILELRTTLNEKA